LASAGSVCPRRQNDDGLTVRVDIASGTGLGEDMILLRSLGDCSIEIDGERLTPASDSLFATMLVAMIDGPKIVRRDALVRLVWPDRDIESGRHCLRQSLYRLAKMGAPVSTDRSVVSLPPGSYRMDFTELHTATDELTAIERARGIHGPFLPGYGPTFSRPMREWVDTNRDRVGSNVRRYLVRAIQLARQRCQWEIVDELASNCRLIDPLNEEATIALAEARAACGSKAEALDILDQYVEEVSARTPELRVAVQILRRRIASTANPKAVATRAVPLVGRAEEMARLVSAMESAVQGAGRAIVIEGEAGVGKSRLVQELCSLASIRGIQTILVKCQIAYSERPLSIYGDLAKELLEVPGAIGCAPATLRELRKLRHRVPDAVSESEPQRDPEYLGSTIRGSVLDLLDAVVSEQALLVVIEDAHWMDPESESLTGRIAAWCRGNRIQVVLTTRPCDAQAFASIRSESQILRLGPLDVASALQLARDLAVSRGAPPANDLIEWCATLSEGSPYHLEQLVSHRLERDAASAPPASVVELQRARICRLSRAALRVLQTTAVLGANATLENLNTLVARRSAGLLDALDELEANRMIVCCVGKVAVRHDLLARAALEAMSPSAKQLLHRQVAALLEDELRRDQSLALLWDCAEHWQRAGSHTKALRLLSSCAQHALLLGAPQRAAHILQQASKLPLSTTDEEAVLSQLLTALQVGGDWPIIIATLERLPVVEHGSSSLSRDDRDLLLLEARWRSGFPWQDVCRDLQACARSVRAKPTHRVKAATMSFMLADNLCDAGDSSALFATLDRALEDVSVAEQQRDYCRMVYHCAFGDFDLAERAAEALLTACRRSARPEEVSRALRHAAAVSFFAGNGRVASIYASEAFAIAARWQLPAASVAAASLLMRLALGDDDRRLAQRWLDVAATHVGEAKDAVTQTNLDTYQCELALRNGEYDKAAALVTKSSLELQHNVSPRVGARLAALSLMLRLVSDGEAPTPEESAKMLALHESTRGHNDVDLAAVAAFVAIATGGDPGRAATCATDYLKRFRRDRSPVPKALSAVAKLGPSDAFAENPRQWLGVLLR